MEGVRNKFMYLLVQSCYRSIEQDYKIYLLISEKKVGGMEVCE